MAAGRKALIRRSLEQARGGKRQAYLAPAQYRAEDDHLTPHQKHEDERRQRRREREREKKGPTNTMGEGRLGSNANPHGRYPA